MHYFYPLSSPSGKFLSPTFSSCKNLTLPYLAEYKLILFQKPVHHLKLDPQEPDPELELEPRLKLEPESGSPRLGFVQLNSGDTSFNTTLNLTGPILLGLGIAAATLFYAYFNAFQG